MSESKIAQSMWETRHKTQEKQRGELGWRRISLNPAQGQHLSSWGEPGEDPPWITLPRGGRETPFLREPLKIEVGRILRARQ